MTTHKPYKQALLPDQASEEIHRNAGIRYDPEVVAAFQRAWQRGSIQQILTEWEAARP
jgi:HD-GYP domain-containing protein (c-di-GMP phosphodiesterase class II)